MKAEFKVCKLTGAIEASGWIGDDNYHISLQDASFFGGKITDDNKGYKYIVTQNGFRTKEGKDYLGLNELTNKDLSFYVKF